MSQGLDLREFLQTASAEGQLESEGAFTLSADQASLKLSQFNLPFVTSWVSKLVQAAHLWNADSISINQTRYATSIFFCPQSVDEIPSPSSILGAITDNSLTSDSHLAALGMALCSLVQQVRLSFVLAVKKGSTISEPIYAGDHTKVLDEKVRADWSHLEKDGIRLTVSHFQGSEARRALYFPSFSRDKVPRRDVQIAKALQQHCGFSTIPIWLDGRAVTELANQATVGASFHFRPLQLALEERGQGSTSFNYRAFQHHGSLKTPKRYLHRTPGSYLLSTMEWHEMDAFFDESLRNPKPGAPGGDRQHNVYWVRHGVLAGYSSFEASTLCTKLSIFLDASELRSDLSGLKVELGEEASSEIHRHLLWMSKRVETFRRHFTGYIKESLYDGEVIDTREMSGQDLKASLSTLGEAVDTPLRNLYRKLPELQDRFRRLTLKTDEKVRFFVNWQFLLEKELEKLALDMKDVSVTHHSGAS